VAAHGALAVMGLFITFLPYIVLVHTVIEKVFFIIGGAIFMLAVLACRYAWMYQAQREKALIRILIPALIVVLSFRVVNVFIASGDIVEIWTNVFLYFSIVLYMLYRAHTLQGFLDYDKRLRNMKGGH
jgi:predicted Abi (CAAX) family protease